MHPQRICRTPAHIHIVYYFLPVFSYMVTSLECGILLLVVFCLHRCFVASGTGALGTTLNLSYNTVRGCLVRRSEETAMHALNKEVSPIL